jgi:hypothetical protein
VSCTSPVVVADLRERTAAMAASAANATRHLFAPAPYFRRARQGCGQPLESLKRSGRRRCRLTCSRALSTSWRSASSMSWAPSRGLALWPRGLRGGCSVRTTFPTTKITPAACHLPRPHDHGSTTREDLGGGARDPGPARVGLLGLQCSARALFRAAPSIFFDTHRIFI